MPNFNPEDLSGQFIESNNQIKYQDSDIDFLFKNIYDLMLEAKKKKEEIDSAIEKLEQDGADIRQQIRNLDENEPVTWDDTYTDEAHDDWEADYNDLSDKEIEIALRIIALETVSENLGEFITLMQN